MEITGGASEIAILAVDNRTILPAFNILTLRAGDITRN
jgi:hypothetical protein